MIFRASDDLTVEANHGGEAHSFLILTSAGTMGGVIVVYPNEICKLINALVEAAVFLATEEGKHETNA